MSEATIILGHQGAGKTRKALAIAEAYKNHVVINYLSLKSPFELGDTLCESPECVIVEEAPLDTLGDPDIRTLITSDPISIDRKYKNRIAVKAPKMWIFTVQLASRRFNVISI